MVSSGRKHTTDTIQCETGNHVQRYRNFALHPQPKGAAMMTLFRRLMRNSQGVTAIEYTLIAALISVAAIAAMGAVGVRVNGVLSNVASAMN